MFTNKNKKMSEDLKQALAPVEAVAGKVIRSYAQSVQEDAWMVAYIAYAEGEDILCVLKAWRGKTRKDNKKVLCFTSARPLAGDKAEFLRILGDYK
jgi:hypothetical protein